MSHQISLNKLVHGDGFLVPPFQMEQRTRPSVLLFWGFAQNRRDSHENSRFRTKFMDIRTIFENFAHFYMVFAQFLFKFAHIAHIF